MTKESSCGLKIADVKAVNYFDRKNFGMARYLVLGFEVNFFCDTCLFVKDVRKSLDTNFVAEDLKKAEQFIKNSPDLQELIEIRSKIILEQCPAYRHLKRRSR